MHVDFNSYFATVEQQANPRLRGKPIGVTGGDRMQRTVLGAASVEAKKFGVKTGMAIPEARRICPQIILVPGDSNKYLATTRRFLNILKDYTPLLEVFSIDEAFLELSGPRANDPLQTAEEIKDKIRKEVGDWITCSIGISYNKLMAKLAGSLYKPDGLVWIKDEEAAQFILDRVALDDVCGIGGRIKYRLNNMGVFDFPGLRKIPLEFLLASFKSYGQILYNMARGIDHSEIMPFYEKEEVKSIGHRHTVDHDTSDPEEIKQVLLKITELIARRLRSKKLLGKTVVCYFRYRSDPDRTGFSGDGMQATVPYTQDGLDIFNGAWRIFNHLWDGTKIRMIGATVSNLRPITPENLTLLEEKRRQAVIIQAIDKINDKYGEFKLQRGILLRSANVYRKPNPYLSDRRFKL